MKTLSLLVLVSFISLSAQASLVAIIDSGTDMQHEMIIKKAFINAREIPGNNRDEDRNGYQDDIHGWNFAESNGEVIDYSYLGLLNDDLRLFFDLQLKMFKGTIQPSEVAWIKEAVANPDFIKRLSIYGNFMHGTHVAGISIRENKDAEVMAIKLIPTEVKLPGSESEEIAISRLKIISTEENEEIAPSEIDFGLGEMILKQGLSFLAVQQMNTMEEIGRYLDFHKVDIANGSFGTGYPQASQIITIIFKQVLRKDPTPEELHKYSSYFLNELVKEGARFVEAAPNTLFVFAAGNDGLNNDIYPTSPTNIQADNVISVAATMELGSLASFSNYGQTLVDVAAPGVGIESAVPGNKYLRVSGTSQAAPFVTHVASMVKDQNPKLTSFEMKKIIMGTVDTREFLVGKIKSSGLVNLVRAVEAARISLRTSVNEAISQAMVSIADQEGEGSFRNKIFETAPGMMIDGAVLPLPSPFKVPASF